MAKRVTDWFSRVWHWKFTRNETAVHVTEEEHLTKALGRYEPYIIKVQRVLVWEKPAVSVFCILAVNFLFWLAVNFECRFYGFVFWLLLLGFLYDMWIDRIWPEISVPVEGRRQNTEDSMGIHPRGDKYERMERGGLHWGITSLVTDNIILSIPEMSHYISETHIYLKNYYSWLKSIRSDQPGMFCCGMSCCFVTLTLVGRAIPGSVIAYVIVMMLMVGPGLYIHILPPTVLERMRYIRTFFKMKSKDTDSEVEEYLPEQTGENLALLQLAGEPVDYDKDEDLEPSLNGTEEFALDTETGDSSNTHTSFTTGVSVMPSHDEGSTDGLDVSEFDLATSAQSPSQKSESQYTKRALDPDLSDTDDEDIAGIHFQSSHFNGDSSDEDEKAFTQGLTFSEVGQSSSKTKEPSAAPQGIGEMLTASVMQAVSKNISNLGAVGQSLLSTVINTGTKKREERTSSEDSEEDFEMISQDDLS